MPVEELDVDLGLQPSYLGRQAGLGDPQSSVRARDAALRGDRDAIAQVRELRGSGRSVEAEQRELRGRRLLAIERGEVRREHERAGSPLGDGELGPAIVRNLGGG